MACFTLSILFPVYFIFLCLAPFFCLLMSLRECLSNSCTKGIRSCDTPKLDVFFPGFFKTPHFLCSRKRKLFITYKYIERRTSTAYYLSFVGRVSWIWKKTEKRCFGKMIYKLTLLRSETGTSLGLEIFFALWVFFPLTSLFFCVCSHQRC